MITKTEDFSHPELRDSEVLFLNSNKVNFDNLKFETKRNGSVAYDGVGNKLDHDNWFPVFLQEEEVLSSGKTLLELRRNQIAEYN